MNLRTKHILAVSAVAGISGFIGFAIGYRRGRVKEYVEEPQEEEIMVEAPRVVKAILGLDYIPESLYEKYTGKKYDDHTDKKDDNLPVWEPNPYNDEKELKNMFIRDNLKKMSYWDTLGPIKDGGISMASYHARVQDYISKEVEKDTDDEPDIENIRTQGEVEYTSDEPYLVSEDAVFTSETSSDDVETLTYYKDDHVLADSYDDVVIEKSLVIGTLDKDVLSTMPGGKTVYVRNPRTKRDYEVIVLDESYEVEVLGADEEQYKNAVKFFKLGDE